MEGLDRFEKAMTIMMAMIFVLNFIHQLWNPTYWGGVVTGYLFGFTIVYGMLTWMVQDWRDLAKRGLNLCSKLQKKNEDLEMQLFFTRKYQNPMPEEKKKVVKRKPGRPKKK